eukprot:TRINITY_DN2639_c1_g1_i1.p1 TRINITY_DN2639_c1_g1~~TRINITY_DN2639_c1_g1_i1.p1  ORF type:complete len:726 (-),score=176.19 TRINITY_DN2639_c1_g1_i1:283-2190(-)
MAKVSSRMATPVCTAQEQPIKVTTIIASVIESDFVPYYSQVMPQLKHIVLTATDSQYRILRGKAFECMSLMGVAVGREVFHQDAQEAIKMLLETANRDLEPSDPLQVYVYESVHRLCRLLKEYFVPYLIYLLPGIYAKMKIQPMVMDEEEDQDEMTECILLDGKRVGLKTSQIDDLQNALQMLKCFLEVLGHHFCDHLKDTGECLMKAVNFPFNDNIKREALDAWRELVAAAVAAEATTAIDTAPIATPSAHNSTLSSQSTTAARAKLHGEFASLPSHLLQKFLRAILEIMRKEEDLEQLQVQTVGVTACVKAAGAETMTMKEVEELCLEIKQLLEESTKRLQDSEDLRFFDEDDEVEAEAQRGADQSLRLKYAELLGAIMEVHGSHFLKVGFAQFLPMIQECFAPSGGRSPTVGDRCLALYLLSDVFEKLGSKGLVPCLGFVDAILESIKDGDAWVRQAAAYAVLHVTKLSEFSKLADRSAQLLAVVIKEPQSRKAGNKEATEAAVAALGQIFRSQEKNLRNPEKLLLLFLQSLPLYEDLNEAGPTHDLLMDLVLEGHQFFSQQQNLEKACRVFLDVYNAETSSESLNSNICKVILKAGGEKLGQMHPRLDESQQKRLRQIVHEAKQLSLTKKG